jgi:hypothetical protein
VEDQAGGSEHANHRGERGRRMGDQPIGTLHTGRDGLDVPSHSQGFPRRREPPYRTESLERVRVADQVASAASAARRASSAP